MAASLEGVRAKLGRAEEHLQALHAEARSFEQREPHSVTREREPEEGWQLAYFHVHEEPPLRLGLILGDFFYNLRSALRPSRLAARASGRRHAWASGRAREAAPSKASAKITSMPPSRCSRTRLGTTRAAAPSPSSTPTATGTSTRRSIRPSPCSTPNPKLSSSGANHSSRLTSDARGGVSTQQTVGIPETVEVEITNNDSKTFSGLAIEFAQASAWTIQNVRPNGEPLGQKTYRLGSIAPGETVQAEAVLIPHTAGNWTLTMNLYGDARSDGIKLDYAGTFDFEVAVSP